MPVANRILDPEPVPTLPAYLQNGGGEGLAAARALGAPATIDEVLAAGIRGRGGAGFPTGVKWRTVAANASPVERSTVVVTDCRCCPTSSPVLPAGWPRRVRYSWSAVLHKSSRSSARCR